MAAPVQRRQDCAYWRLYFLTAADKAIVELPSAADLKRC